MKVYSVTDTREVNQLDDLKLFLNEEDAENYRLSWGIEQFSIDVIELEVIE